MNQVERVSATLWRVSDVTFDKREKNELER